jgi:phosphatidate phosphatase PAH1
MRGFQLLCLSTLFACAVEHETPDPTPGGMGSGTGSGDTAQPIPEVRCATAPSTGAATDWRHTTSAITAAVGDPHHRGIDLIATAEEAAQVLAGKLAYGPTDKDLEDEDVEVFACIDAAWSKLATVRTDGDGRFSLSLTGDARLPIGMRDLFVSVMGDRSGAPFIGFVAPSGARMVVSDVDGTLTASENAYPEALALGGDVAVQPGAPSALQMLKARGYSVVYITARGDRFTQDTRDWFASKAFPRGPMRLPSAIVTLPGADTIDFKRSAIQSLAAFDVAAGFGNRSTDVTAYMEAGLPADRIFIKLPEFSEELATQLGAGAATGFDLYDTLRANQLEAM